MSVPALTLAQATSGSLITLYGQTVLGVSLDAAAAGLDAGADAAGFGFASVAAFRVAGLPCTRLPRPLLIPLPGPGTPLKHAECGFEPGEAVKWSLPASTRLTALSPSVGEAGTLLAGLAQADAASHDCACKHGAAPAAALLGASDALEVLAQACISVNIQNGQACLNIPIYGSVCIPVPNWVPNGTAVQACIDTCSKFGIPCGVKVTLTALGQTLASKSFGCC